MRFTIVAAVALALAGVGLVGCGNGSGPAEAKPMQARQIDDGAEKYSPMQVKCPVCKTQELAAEIHSDVDGKRVYFDKEECKQKFDQDPQKYLDQWKTYEDFQREGVQKSREAGRGPR